jgi:chromosome condensin MukBEF MukE localization factor
MKVVSWMKRGRRKDTAVVVDADKEQEKTRAAIPKRRRIGLRGLMVGFMGLITVGLIRISRGSQGSISSVMASRYQAVYQNLPWGRMYK